MLHCAAYCTQTRRERERESGGEKRRCGERGRQVGALLPSPLRAYRHGEMYMQSEESSVQEMRESNVYTDTRDVHGERRLKCADFFRDMWPDSLEDWYTHMHVCEQKGYGNADNR